MASLVASLQIAGYPSVANGGNPANGTGLLGSSTIEFWSDNALVITTAAGKRVRLDEDTRLNNLFDQILKGTNGLSTSKQFLKAS